MPKQPINYDNVIIYKLVCKDIDIVDCYVGYTTSFVSKKYDHKHACNNINDKKYNMYVYEFIRNNGGWDNWDMIVIEKCSCKDVDEVKLKTRNYMQSLNARLNKYVRRFE